MFGKRFSRALAVTTVASLIMAAAAFASDANMAIADTTAPTGSVALAPGADGSISITVTVSGAQAGTSSYKVYKDWTLDAAGIWTGTNEATSVAIGPRAGGDPANVQTFAGKVFVDSDVDCDTYSLAVGVHGITNSNTSGGKLEVGASSNYSVVVENCTTNADPVLTLPTDLTVEGNTTDGALVTYSGISASDTEDGDISSSVECTPASGSFFTLGGPHTVTCSVADSAGASDSGTFDVTVVDTTDPTIGTAANITTTTMNASGKVVTYTAPTASDVVDSSVDVECLPASSSTFAIGTTTVTCTATDGSGNSAQSQFTVQVSLLTALWKEPINGPSVVNVAKAGRVIPVKVELFVDGAENVNTGSVTFKLWKSNSCSAAAQDAVETFTAVGEASGGSNYVWNADGGFYQYNLKTPSTAGCYRGEVYLDGELAGYFLITATK